MPAFQYNAFSLQMAQDYFAHLNPLAQRIASDISATKSTYGQLWCTMKPSEQNDILNETLIKPEISWKYFDNFSSPVASLTSDSSSSSSSSSSGTLSATSAEHILQSLSKSKEQKSCIIAGGCASTNSLTDVFIKQTQNLLSSTLATRAKHATASQLHGKLKPPSSPPPPPPVVVAKTSTTVHTTETKSMLGLSKKSRKKYAKEVSEIKVHVAHQIDDDDDVLGTYKDEHSRPFSYRTNSQINLQQLCKQDDLVDITLKSASDEVCLLSNELSNQNNIERRAVTKNYQQLQEELKKTLTNQTEKTRNEDSTNTSTLDNIIYKRFYDSNEISPANNCDVNKHSSCSSEQVATPNTSKPTPITSLRNVNLCGSELSKSVIANHTPDSTYLLNKTPKQKNMTYAVYTDAYFDVAESATLMHNCSNSGILTASSNSSTTSEEEEHNTYDFQDGDGDDDEKTLCEDIRLLENDLNLRRGFDFLNNW